MSGGEESGEVSSGDTVNEAAAGGSSMLAERLLRRTGRGTSTLGFKDWREREKVCVRYTLAAYTLLQQTEHSPSLS